MKTTNYCQRWSSLLALYLSITILNLHVTHAQINDSLFLLKEVEVVANQNHFLTGSQKEQMDSAQLAAISNSSLAELLSQYTPIYIKQDAGGLSTIRLRGTTASHTAVLFEGININSLTLGQSNFSNIPLFLFDGIEIQYGGSAAIHGSDAIGGSIQLQNQVQWGHVFSLSLQQDFGSFGSYFSGLKLTLANRKLHYQLKAYYKQKENDFPFINIAIKDFETNSYRLDTTRNAASQDWGVIQSLNCKISPSFTTFARLWLEANERQVQMNMSSNYYGGSEDEIANFALRAIAGLNYYLGHGKLSLQTAYLHSNQVYNSQEEQNIACQTRLFKLDYTHAKCLGGELLMGAQYQHITPDVHAYSNDPKETRTELYSSYKRVWLKHLNTSFNLRETIVSNYKNKFTPSLGLSSTILNRNKHNVSLRGALAQSYKIPTLNDRFWIPGGKPDLLPETSLSAEMGGDYRYHNKQQDLSLSFTAYTMNVDHWIQWVNQGEWQAENIKKVRSQGFELKTQWLQQLGLFQWKIGAAYSFTHAREQASYTSTTVSSEQMIYTPKHLFNAYSSLAYRSWLLACNMKYVDQRRTENNTYLSAYQLYSMALSRELNMHRHKFNLSIRCNNITDRSYQNQELYAMPGRNYHLSIKYYIHH